MPLSTSEPPQCLPHPLYPSRQRSWPLPSGRPTRSALPRGRRPLDSYPRATVATSGCPCRVCSSRGPDLQAVMGQPQWHQIPRHSATQIERQRARSASRWNAIPVSRKVHFPVILTPNRVLRSWSPHSAFTSRGVLHSNRQDQCAIGLYPASQPDRQP